MDYEKMTTKVQQALSESQKIAIKYDHQQIDIIHLFMALISQEDGIVPNIFSRIGVDVELLKQATHKELDRMPKVLGEGASTSAIYLVRRVEEVFLKAEDYASKFKDSYVSVEHIVLAIMDIDHKGTVGRLLSDFNIDKDKFLAVLSQVRGNQRVETQDPEGTYDALKSMEETWLKRLKNIS